MAASAAASRLTEAHRLAQARVGAATVAQLFSAWQLLDLERLDATIATWLRVAVPIVAGQARRSSALAADYLHTFRAVELGTLTGFTPKLASIDTTAAATSLTVTGPVAIKAATSRGVPISRAADTAMARAAAAGMRHALAGGRLTVAETVKADPQAVGYRRATSGNPCNYCQDLADGPIWDAEGDAAFDCHDGCHCEPEPVFAGE